MALSLFFRAASWYWIVGAALPNRPVRRRDVTSATMIGVLMSATLPARLGEPARALALSRRTGRVRETFPVIIGTLVSQTLLNIVALLILGVIIVSTTPLFHSSTQKIFAFSFVPLALLLVVLRRADADAAPGQRAHGQAGCRDIPRPDSGPGRTRRLPRAPSWPPRLDGPARSLGDPAGGLLGAVRGSGPRRQGRHRSRRGGPLRGQRHGRRPRHALEHRCLPVRRLQRADHRLGHRPRGRSRLRRDPAGGGDRHRGRSSACRPWSARA